MSGSQLGWTAIVALSRDVEVFVVEEVAARVVSSVITTRPVGGAVAAHPPTPAPMTPTASTAAAPGFGESSSLQGQSRRGTAAEKSPAAWPRRCPPLADREEGAR